jgi:predicted amidohydrolase YtcJ
MDILIKNALTITMNEQNDILECADVALRGDRIVYVGQSRDWMKVHLRK